MASQNDRTMRRDLLPIVTLAFVLALPSPGLPIRDFFLDVESLQVDLKALMNEANSRNREAEFELGVDKKCFESMRWVSVDG